MRINDSLRKQLTLVLILFSAVPPVLIGGILTAISYNALKKQTLVNHEQILRTVSLESFSLIHEAEDDLRALVEMRGILTMSRNEQRNTLNALMAFRQNFYEELRYSDAQGNDLVYISRSRLIGSDEFSNRSDEQEFILAREKMTPQYSSIFLNSKTGEPYLSVTIPIKELRTGTFQGALWGKIRFRPIWDVMKKLEDQTESIPYIVDSENRVVAHPDPSLVLRETFFIPPAEKGFYTGISGHLSILAVETIDLYGKQFTIVSEQRAAEALALAYSIIVIVLVFLLAGLGAAVFWGVVLARKIVRPIYELSVSVRKMGGGELSERAAVQGTLEIQELAETFNHMSDEVRTLVSGLENTRNFLSNVINSMPSMIFGIDEQGHITMWNLEAEKETDLTYETVAGKKILDVLPRFSRRWSLIEKAIAETRIIQEVRQASQKNGSTIYEDFTVYPLISDGVQGAVVRIDNVTEKVRMEEMMIQSDKMLSVGGLAAGMAHEINNPLAGMLQTADVMENRLKKKINLPANRKAAEEAGTSIEAVVAFLEKRNIIKMVSSIRESGKRVSGIVSNMLSFSRKSENALSLHNMVELVDQVLVLASSDYNLKKHYDFREIEILKEYDASLPSVNCEGSKIQQVLLNLFKNGAEAMKEASTANPRFIIRLRNLPEQKMLEIELQDNGPGIPEEIRKRIFEPFFTTKAEGVGTGLGLFISYFIITENHRGEMFVESAPEKGTKFVIRLPV